MRKNHVFIILSVLAGLALVAAHGQSGGRIPFPHATHVEAGAECSTCHEGVEAAGDLTRSYLPSAEVCGTCHEASDLETWGWASVPARASGFRGFSHAAHLGGESDCTPCHGALVDATLAGTGQGEPGHATCTACHHEEGPSAECADCHSDLRSGRLNAFRRDPTILKPSSHHPGYLHDHQFAARLEGGTCRECHPSQDFCSDCHEGTNLDVLVHDRNWEHTHPVEARKNVQACTTCHDLQTDCTDCHAAQGVKPGNHSASNWASATFGGLHAELARRDISVCAACHEGEEFINCTSCHADRDPGLGNDPTVHGTSLRSDAGEGPWHDDPDASCFSCHDRNAPSQFCSYCHSGRN